jgi:hypothetical protein
VTGLLGSLVQADPVPISWTSEGTFDVTNFPLGTAINTFSSSTPFGLGDVQFSHTVDAREDGSLRLYGGTFEIKSTGGDSLRGTYEDFIYNAPTAEGIYLGSGPFELTGGTGQFLGASGHGSWNATARFTSSTGGTADHVWDGSVNLIPQPIPITWTSEGTFDVTNFPAGTAINTFSSSSPLDLSNVQFSHTVEAREDGSLRLYGGTFEIVGPGGDVLRGTYEDFIYGAPSAEGIYLGSGPFELTGGTGQFAGASGQGSWKATAGFTSATGGTADHIWEGNFFIVPPLQPGDADQDRDFDELDLIMVQQAAKYRTGQRATWGEGDWNGAPGGRLGSPPLGNGLFDQFDIIPALSSATYLTGKYAALAGPGMAGDGQTSIIYDATNGELAVDAPAGIQLTSVNIDSAAGIFTGAAAQNLGGSFDNDSDNNIFKATFGSSFGSLSFGNVAQPGLAENLLLSDLSVVGSLAGGGALGNVDLIYVPEPSAIVLIVLGALGVIAWRPLGVRIASTWQ